MVGAWRRSRALLVTATRRSWSAAGSEVLLLPAALPRLGSTWPSSNAGVAMKLGAFRDRHEVVSTACSGTRAGRMTSGR
jgi:hypothetical protein